MKYNKQELIEQIKRAYFGNEDRIPLGDILERCIPNDPIIEEPNGNPLRSKGPQPPECKFRISVKTIEKDFFGGYDKITESQFTDLNEAFLFYLRSPQDQFASTTVQLIHIL